MREESAEACVRCGAGGAEWSVLPPLEWVDYLCEERGMARPVGTVRFPLCGSCYPRVDHLKTTRSGRQARRDAEGPALHGDVRELLDRIDIDGVVAEVDYAGGEG